MPISRRDCLLLGAVLCAALGAMPLLAAAAAPAPVVVFAAASLTDAVQQIAADYQRDTGVAVTASFGASSALARQIESGAPADLFLSADREWMDELQARGLMRAGTRQDLLGNRLVLVSPRDTPLALRIAPGRALASALGDGRWVTGDPDSVPVGRYAKAALVHLGAWDTLEPRLVRADNVRAALALVARGEVAFGIVYSTDALVEPRVRVVDTFAADTHPPIIYPVALTAGAAAQAQRFLAYLRGADAAAVFRRFGFVTLPP